MNETMRQVVIAYLTALNLSSNMDCYDVERQVDKVHVMDVADSVGPVKVSDGASKICLVFKTLPFVIKWNPYGYGEAMQEVSIYQDAVKRGLEYFFPKTEFFFEYNGISFVAQEKIDFAADEVSSSREYSKFIQRVTKTPTHKIYEKMQREFNKAGSSYRRTLDESWAKMVISLYGKNAAKALCKFIIDHQINDLHSSNIGYKNHRPIILDFSGYHR